MARCMNLLDDLGLEQSPGLVPQTYLPLLPVRRLPGYCADSTGPTLPGDPMDTLVVLCQIQTDKAVNALLR